MRCTAAPSDSAALRREIGYGARVAELAELIRAVDTALADTERECEQLPFFVRPIVRRGFSKRTGRDIAGWRALLSQARRGEHSRALVDGLPALAEHYRGALERAKRGMGATSAQLALIEQRSRERAAAVDALHTALAA